MVVDGIWIEPEISLRTTQRHPRRDPCLVQPDHPAARHLGAVQKKEDHGLVGEVVCVGQGRQARGVKVEEERVGVGSGEGVVERAQVRVGSG